MRGDDESPAWEYDDFGNSIISLSPIEPREIRWTDQQDASVWAMPGITVEIVVRADWYSIPQGPIKYGPPALVLTGGSAGTGLDFLSPRLVPLLQDVQARFGTSPIKSLSFRVVHESRSREMQRMDGNLLHRLWTWLFPRAESRTVARAVPAGPSTGEAA